MERRGAGGTRGRGRTGALLVTLLLGGLLAASVPPGLGAQEPGDPPPPLRLRLAPDGGVRILLGEILGDTRLVSALRDGLPVRLGVRVELWRSGSLVDRLAGEFEWRAVAVYEPVEEGYELQVGTGSTPDRRFYPGIAGLRRALRDTLAPGLSPEPGGRYYYLGTLEVETLSLSDLEELQRWLRGELAPSVEGERGVGSTLASGLRRLLVRILGLPVRRYRTDTEPFRIPEEGGGGAGGDREEEADGDGGGDAGPPAGRTGHPPARSPGPAQPGSSSAGASSPAPGLLLHRSGFRRNFPGRAPV